MHSRLDELATRPFPAERPQLRRGRQGLSSQWLVSLGLGTHVASWLSDGMALATGRVAPRHDAAPGLGQPRAEAAATSALDALPGSQLAMSAAPAPPDRTHPSHRQGHGPDGSADPGAPGDGAEPAAASRWLEREAASRGGGHLGRARSNIPGRSPVPPMKHVGATTVRADLAKSATPEGDR